MSNPYLLFFIPASPIIALIVDSAKQKHSELTTISLCFLSFLLAAPILFTNYNYTGEFSNYLVAAVISVMLNICWMQYVKRKPKLLISTLLAVFSILPISLVFFGRAFVGGPEIYSSTKSSGYKVVHKRDGSPGILEPDYFALYKIMALGVLENYICRQYSEEGECQVILKDSIRQKTIFYDQCVNKLQVKRTSANTGLPK